LFLYEREEGRNWEGNEDGEDKIKGRRKNTKKGLRRSRSKRDKIKEQLNEKK